MTEVVQRGWEVIANSVDMGTLHHGGLDRGDEAVLIDECLTTLRSMSGQPVTGWLSPARSESMNTLELLAARGVQYVGDWCNDDMPYPMTTAGGPLHAMPLSHELDDQTIMFHYHQTEREFVDQVQDAHRVLHQEAIDAGSGRILSLVIHPWVSGQPHRIMALRDALSSVMESDRVWSASGRQILDSFVAQSAQ